MDASPVRAASIVSARQSGASAQANATANVELAFSVIAPSRTKSESFCDMPMVPAPSTTIFEIVNLRVPPPDLFLSPRVPPPVSVKERPPNAMSSLDSTGVRSKRLDPTMKSEFAKSETVAVDDAPCVVFQPCVLSTLPAKDEVFFSSLPTL